MKGGKGGADSRGYCGTWVHLQSVLSKFVGVNFGSVGNITFFKRVFYVEFLEKIHK